MLYSTPQTRTVVSQPLQKYASLSRAIAMAMLLDRRRRLQTQIGRGTRDFHKGVSGARPTPEAPHPTFGLRQRSRYAARQAKKGA